MSELKVCVRLLSGEQCCFALTRTATAWDLQGAIKEKLGIRRRYQQLVVGVDLLCGNTNLSQFAPQELARIMLVIVGTRACGGCCASSTSHSANCECFTADVCLYWPLRAPMCKLSCSSLHSWELMSPTTAGTWTGTPRWASKATRGITWTKLLIMCPRAIIFVFGTGEHGKH